MYANRATVMENKDIWPIKYRLEQNLLITAVRYVTKTEQLKKMVKEVYYEITVELKYGSTL